MSGKHKASIVGTGGVGVENSFSPRRAEWLS